MLEIPAGLVPAKDMLVAEEMRKMLAPKDCEFSKFFPRIRGTPAKRIPFKGRRFRPPHDWSKVGCHAEAMKFFEFADKVFQERQEKEEGFKLTGLSLRPEVMFLFARYCNFRRIKGAQKATMKRFVMNELPALRKEIEELPA